MNLQEAEDMMLVDCHDPGCTEAGWLIRAELRDVRSALRILLAALESPDRAIYADEVAAARRALHMEPSLPDPELEAAQARWVERFS